MEPISSGFETLAELAGALLGFAAIAFALARGPEALRPEDRVRLWLLLSVSVLALLGGVLPQVLATAGISGPMLWRWWSAAYIFAGVQVIGGALIGYARMDAVQRARYRGEDLMARSIVSSQHFFLALAFASQVLNALGIGVTGAQWVCLGGLLLTVVQAAILLLTLVFLRPSPGTSVGRRPQGGPGCGFDAQHRATPGISSASAPRWWRTTSRKGSWRLSGSRRPR